MVEEKIKLRRRALWKGRLGIRHAQVKKEEKRRNKVFMVASVGQGDGEPQGEGRPI